MKITIKKSFKKSEDLLLIVLKGRGIGLPYLHIQTILVGFGRLLDTEHPADLGYLDNAKALFLLIIFLYYIERIKILNE